MTRTHGRSGLFVYLVQPLCIVLLAVGAFGLVWLRSSVVSSTYEIRSLEEKKIAAMKEMKLLMAERSKLMSLARVGTPSASGRQGGMQLAKGNMHAANSDFVFPDRTMVVHVRKGGATDTFRASYKVKEPQR